MSIFNHTGNREQGAVGARVFTAPTAASTAQKRPHSPFKSLKLYKTLQEIQEIAIATGLPQIASIAQSLPPFDPLLFLQENFAQTQPYFYLENVHKGEAIAALGQVQFTTLETQNRFMRSQQFITDCFQRSWTLGKTDFPGAGLRCFGAFTFGKGLGKHQTETSLSAFKPVTLFIPKLQLSLHQNKTHLVTNFKIDGYTQITDIFKTLQTVQDALERSRTRFFSDSPKNCCKIGYKNNPKQDHLFKKSVQSALNLIQEKTLQKIVLAYAQDLFYPLPVQVIESLHHLRTCHPDCYIFSVSAGQKSHFLGASPERLISIHQGCLETDALAGTAPRGKNLEEDQQFARQLQESEKEKREHQAVSDYITQKLKQLGLNPEKEILQLLKLSHLQHLWTPITAQLPPHLHPLEIVAQLHPTPAVAGVPTPVACDYIQQYEMRDRSLYASPLGWVDQQGNSEFIVGIRSALITGNQATLYGGAGIVEGSDPDKEFAEIQLKLQTMLRALS